MCAQKAVLKWNGREGWTCPNQQLKPVQWLGTDQVRPPSLRFDGRASGGDLGPIVPHHVSFADIANEGVPQTASRYSKVSGNSVAGDAGIPTCRPASRSAATPIRQCHVLGAESLLGAGSALRLIRPTSNSRTPSISVKRVAIKSVDQHSRGISTGK
mgnify:CR=1 FL=1